MFLRWAVFIVERFHPFELDLPQRIDIFSHETTQCARSGRRLQQ